MLSHKSTLLTLNEVTTALDQRGLAWRNRGRYILSQAPCHQDKNPSFQIYTDDWFSLCHVCGRHPIQEVMPELSKSSQFDSQKQFDGENRVETRVEKKEAVKPLYSPSQLFEIWQKLPLIPETHNLKGVPAEHLNDLGWRWTNNHIKGMGIGYFIPYFNAAKDKIPFAQTRHLTGNRRFSMLTNAKPTIYGKWNIYPNDPVFLVEGTSDAVVLDYCAVPAIAMPSSSSVSLLENLVKYCQEHNVRLIYAGDNDEAGDKLKDALGELMPYRNRQPPKKYKDYGEMFEKGGFDEVYNWTHPELAY